ncbi:MAG: cytochrome C [Bacteroidales bacterium]
MTKGGNISLLLILVAIIVSGPSFAQISPGDLAKPHEFLEGITNCTKCHEIGNKITGEKCLGCHTEINDRIKAGKGYHSSSGVKGRECIECHSDHHGKNFQLVRLNNSGFDHNLTGFSLSVPHSKLECTACHTGKFIKESKIREKKFTYLGLGTACLDCHADYHLGTLSSSCLTCHSPGSFKTAPAFNHSKTRFALAGKHKSVECVKCHKMETVNGNKFQEFRGVAFASCTNCHKDPHQNKFGQDCRKCHNEESFTSVTAISNFDHSKTKFPLVDRHLTVSCKSCHKNKLTAPLKYDRCTDCHEDYHKGQFTANGIAPDCNECHNVKGFALSTFTIDRHNQGAFPLRGAHSAQPCNECHWKQDAWTFAGLGKECRDCHPDIHKQFISSKFYPDENCRACHNETAWRQVTFDHSATQFKLTGAHAKTSCTVCHISRTAGGEFVQKFEGLGTDCISCHNDVHQGQFSGNSQGTCTVCHVTDNWMPSKFDHSKTAFPLDGKHTEVSCSACHKALTKGNISYTLYKIKDFRCEACHF